MPQHWTTGSRGDKGVLTLTPFQALGVHGGHPERPGGAAAGTTDRIRREIFTFSYNFRRSERRLRTRTDRCVWSTTSACLYFRPSFLPAERSSVDSWIRRSRVSGRLAVWIQTTKSRRFRAERLRKKFQASGLAWNAAAM